MFDSRLQRLRPAARKAVAAFLATAGDQDPLLVLEWQDNLDLWPQYVGGVRTEVLNALTALGGLRCPEDPNHAVSFRTTAALLHAMTEMRQHHSDFVGISAAMAAAFGRPERPAVARSVIIHKVNGRAEVVPQSTQFFVL
ncbi:hypothetical protein CHLRE_16g671650v5 [Chlamydomonas reinhardtii]|uniref:Uncharacterized protein n=1 Tax=Chlamydomonas reinhardtii TaxID=3055 RepID=A0A2K3CVP1_CHLRE|nr:uncharacterized protein CHLRE_16g671650v5 [Chlamydomonas reinhardtii]XP_042916173.1 uncharacterized protein CHLRE_16g671650v5 [Chlamydomonas reinhardtii]PNW72352.1 hypothetical protein CHLRE_16g671650v5 [Chlamydomonas reinhardtii]PNW72353.1 hypothetical protein CHLRE_16g671650v5 [Chlamydomonas reinhardtii]